MATNDKFTVRVLVFAASLREHSLNDRLATLAARAIEKLGGSVDRASMRDFDCASYDGDEERDGHMPDGAKRLREKLLSSDAFVLVSPEYNASMPGVIKNTIDWASRFRPQPFTRRQGLLMSASPAMAGGNRGLWSLRIPLEHLGARIYPDVLARPGAPGVRGRRDDSERGAAAAIRIHDLLLAPAGGSSQALPGHKDAVGRVPR